MIQSNTNRQAMPAPPRANRRLPGTREEGAGGLCTRDGIGGEQLQKRIIVLAFIVLPFAVLESGQSLLKVRIYCFGVAHRFLACQVNQRQRGAICRCGRESKEDRQSRSGYAMGREGKATEDED